MQKYLISGLIGLFLLVILACGSDATSTPSDAGQAAPAPTTAQASVQPAADGEKFKIQYACINRTLDPCELVNDFLVPRMLEATNGRVEIEVTSFPELGIAGPDTLELVGDGTLGFGEIYAGYVGGSLPIVDAQYLWGTVRDRDAKRDAVIAARSVLDQAVSDATNGGIVLIRNWYPSDNFVFSSKSLTKVEDFKGLKIRTHSTVLGDWLAGFEADGQFVAFSEVYTALERGILDAAVTCASCGEGVRWYEITKYLAGPIPDRAHTWGVVNKKIWDSMPPDLQQTVRAVAEEYNTLVDSKVTEWERVAMERLLAEGMILQEFSPEVAQKSWDTALEIIIPNWVKRTGGAGSEAVAMWNEYFAPRLGVEITSDGMAREVSITLGPAAGSSTTTTVPAALAEFAAKKAGGPGAIFVGDLNQLVGPAPTPKQGDFDGNVTIGALQNHLWIYDSDYYRGLLEKARLTNPTEMVTSGFSIEIQHACINRALLPCELLDSYFSPNILERTNGQIEFVVTSFPELGLAGPDTLSLVTDGTLSSATIYGGYVGGEMPPIEIQNLWGMYPDRETEYAATALIFEDLEKLVRDATGGVILNHNWYSGNDQFFFSKKPLRTLDDFKGLKTRSHSAALSDWIEGMGADAQFVAFSEVYTALERGILEAGVTGADAGYGQRWYEVTDYINGPLVSFPSNNNIINGKVWAKIPADLQQIMIEEGARSELEALRIASIQNEMGLLKNTTEGMEFVEFSKELTDRSLNFSVMQNVIPAWVNRVGGADHPIIKIFNEKVGAMVGLHIEDDGSVTKR